MYPYETSIYYDARNNYDIVYDPYYEPAYDTSHYDRMFLDGDDHEDDYYYEPNAAPPTKTKQQPVAQEPYVPFRRSRHTEPYKPRQRRNDMSLNEMTVNETPMYVRPYLEDPIFLQPDDDEVSMLHHLEAHHADEHYHETHHHDLPGDPDLENPSRDEVEQHEEEPAFIAEHRNILERTREIVNGPKVNPNGFRKTGEPCNHNFECISNKCVSFLNKAPACMPF